MKILSLKNLERTYKNNGQHAEQVLRFTLTGEIIKADNLPAELGADIFDIQVKSARATICKGDDLNKYLELDAAKQYAYVNASFEKAYLMNKQEWKQFCETFGALDRESNKNGGGVKIRLGKETKEMMAWLARA